MKKILSIILALTLIFSITGCSAKNEALDSNFGSAIMENGGVNSDSMMSPESPALKDEGTTDDSTVNEYLESQKLIYKCNLTIETLEFAKTTDAIKALIKEHGGFVESDEMSDDSHNWYYSDYEKHYGTLFERLTIRIPTDNYEAFLSDVEGNGKVLNKKEQVINITKEYNDTQTIIQAYEKEQSMLLEMMDKATTISEMITVEERLSEVNRKLALYKNQMSSMDTDIAFSTITMTIEEVVEYTRTIEEKSFVERLFETVKESASEFLEFLEEALFLTIYIFPYCAILALIIVAFIAIKKKRRQAKQYTVKATSTTNETQKEQDEKKEEK